LIDLFKTFKRLSHVRIDELFMLDENTKVLEVTVWN